MNDKVCLLCDNSPPPPPVICTICHVFVLLFFYISSLEQGGLEKMVTVGNDYGFYQCK